MVLVVQFNPRPDTRAAAESSQSPVKTGLMKRILAFLSPRTEGQGYSDCFTRVKLTDLARA